MGEEDEEQKERDGMRVGEKDREEGIEDIIVFHRESTLYLCTSNHVHHRLAICLLINHRL